MRQEQSETIAVIKDEDGKMISKPHVINEQFKMFYSKLYSCEKEPLSQYIESFLSNLRLLELSTDQQSSLAKPIRLDEVRNVINKLSTGKIAGVDSYPVVRNWVFVDVLAESLL